MPQIVPVGTQNAVFPTPAEFFSIFCFPKCSPGHVECSFDNPAENFLKFEKKSKFLRNFEKVFWLQMSVLTRRNNFWERQ